MDLEEMLLQWIPLQRSKNLRVSRKFFQRKVRLYAEEKAANKGQMNDGASEGWLEKLISRNRLLLRCHTTRAQKTPGQIIDKKISYLLYAGRYFISFGITMNWIALLQ